MKITIAIFYIIVSQVTYSQSLAVNILFDQAHMVYKGTVQEIIYAGSDGEGDEFTVFTSVDKVYKGIFYGDRIGITCKKLLEIDTLTWTMIQKNEFNLIIDSSYIFILDNLGESKSNGQYVCFSEQFNPYIEGIPYSIDLGKELESFNKFIYFDESGTNSALNTLIQSSPVKIEGEVIKISQSKGLYNYVLKVIYGTHKTLKVKVRGLNCICQGSSIELNKRYLFFLTPYNKKTYLLTDRWIGILEINSIIHPLLKELHSK